MTSESKKKEANKAATKRQFVVSCLFCDQEKFSDDHGQQAAPDESRSRKTELTDDSDVGSSFSDFRMAE